MSHELTIRANKQVEFAFRESEGAAWHGLGNPMQDNATIDELRPQIPVMSDADTALIVETWRNFTPAFQVGLDRRTFYQITVTRPRFVSPMPFT